MLNIPEIKYERLEDFLGLLKATENKKTPVYVDVIRLSREDGFMTMKVSFMIIKDGCLHQCFYADDMPEMYLLSKEIFNRFSSEKLRNDTFADYQKTLDSFDVSVHGEYQKAEDIIKGLGFPVVMGVVQ